MTKSVYTGERERQAIVIATMPTPITVSNYYTVGVHSTFRLKLLGPLIRRFKAHK